MSLLAEAAGKDTGTYMELSQVLPSINAAPQARELYQSILESLNVSAWLYLYIYNEFWCEYYIYYSKYLRLIFPKNLKYKFHSVMFSTVIWNKVFIEKMKK